MGARTVVRISSAVCSDVTKYLSRAALIGTPGEKIGEALMPRSNNRCMALPTLMEVPTILGRMPSPMLVPVSRPAARASRMKSAPFMRMRCTRCGSDSSTVSAASAAAVIGGGKPTE